MHNYIGGHRLDVFWVLSSLSFSASLWWLCRKSSTALTVFWRFLLPLMYSSIGNLTNYPSSLSCGFFSSYQIFVFDGWTNIPSHNVGFPLLHFMMDLLFRPCSIEAIASQRSRIQHSRWMSQIVVQFAHSFQTFLYIIEYTRWKCQFYHLQFFYIYTSIFNPWSDNYRWRAAECCMWNNKYLCLFSGSL